jgi:hypothetical protein
MGRFANTSSITALVADATVDELTPIANEIEGILSEAAEEILELAGQPIEIVMGTVDGVGLITVPELAKLIDDLLGNVINSLDALEDTFGPKVKAIISDVFCDVMYVHSTSFYPWR